MLFASKENFPQIWPFDLDLHWKVYEVAPRKREQGTALIAIGIREQLCPSGKTIETFAFLINTKDTEPFMFMEGGASILHHSDVKVTSGGVFINHKDLKGRGIGNLIMNESVAWAKRNFAPSMPVVPITIVRSKTAKKQEWDVTFVKLKDFYGRFGFTWPDPAIETDPRQFPSYATKVENLELWPEGKLDYIRKVNLPFTLQSYHNQLTAEKKSEDEKSAEIAKLRGWISEDRKSRSKLVNRRWITLIPVAFIMGLLINFFS